MDIEVFRFVIGHAECVLSGCWYQVTCLSPMDILDMFSTIIIVGKCVSICCILIFDLPTIIVT